MRHLYRSLAAEPSPSADRAGNPAAAETSFDVDTVPPTYTVESPAHESYLATATPAFVIRYQDSGGGVDLARLAFRRITSYNVCYTKLLRTHAPLWGNAGSVPINLTTPMPVIKPEVR